MKRLFWKLLTYISPAHNDELNRLGEGEYLAKHGIANEVKEDYKVIEGEAVIKLQKHLKRV